MANDKYYIGLCENSTKLQFGPEAFARRCSRKIMFLKISQNSKENTCPWVSFLIKLSYLVKVNKRQENDANAVILVSLFLTFNKRGLQKKDFDTTQKFSCELRDICKNNSFYRTPAVAASVSRKYLMGKFEKFSR